MLTYTLIKSHKIATTRLLLPFSVDTLFWSFVIVQVSTGKAQEAVEPSLHRDSRAHLERAKQQLVCAGKHKGVTRLLLVLLSGFFGEVWEGAVDVHGRAACRERCDGQ